MHIEDGLDQGDVWVADVERGTTSRLTFDPAAHGQSPVWAADSRRAFYRALSKDGLSTVYEKDASGAGSERIVYTHRAAGRLAYPTSAAADGTLILAGQQENDAPDLFMLPAAGGSPTPLVAGRGTDLGGQVSPDGRWLAYHSDENGRFEVFVQSFATADTRLQVSTTGGSFPRWRSDSRELFFFSINAGQSLMSVSVTPDGQTLKLGRPTALFSVLFNTPRHSTTVTPYAVADNGQRFLVSRPSGASGNVPGQVPLTVVLNWNAGLR